MEKTIKLSKRASEPMFCRGGDEFIKLVFATIMAFSGENTAEDLSYLAFGIRVLLHEYLALVIKGDLEPYVFDDATIKHEAAGFNSAMNMINEYLTVAGMKMVETDDGRMEIDYDSLTAYFGDDIKHCAVKNRKGKK